MTEARIDLPPLPEPFVETDAKVRGEWAQCVLYTADQMREYARAAVLQERERCSKDAARYRWLKERNRDALAHIAYSVPEACVFAPAGVDDAIDAAIRASPSP
jgi:hypothetical protein